MLHALNSALIALVFLGAVLLVTHDDARMDRAMLTEIAAVATIQR